MWKAAWENRSHALKPSMPLQDCLGVLWHVQSKSLAQKLKFSKMKFELNFWYLNVLSTNIFLFFICHMWHEHANTKLNSVLLKLPCKCCLLPFMNIHVQLESQMAV